MNNHNVLSLIGNTPIVELTRLDVPNDCRIFAKMEFLNPGGSIKDRIVQCIVSDAERNGILKPNSTIVENTSGNTGAAIALIAAQKGYKCILTMPDKVSIEKQNSLKALGAEIHVCPTRALPDSPEHYVQKARSIFEQTPNAFMINQYDNIKNAEAHHATTGLEIWNQLGDSIDAFVVAGSTGGTISGIGRRLKEQTKSVKIIMLDPVGSVYFKYFKEGVLDPNEIAPYAVEGVGEDHLAKCMDFSVVDDVLQFNDDNAFSACRQLAKCEGLLCGGSSGANVWGALKVAESMKGANIVTVLPDSGTKYLSKIFTTQA